MQLAMSFCQSCYRFLSSVAIAHTNPIVRAVLMRCIECAQRMRSNHDMKLQILTTSNCMDCKDAAVVVLAMQGLRNGTKLGELGLVTSVHDLCGAQSLYQRDRINCSINSQKYYRCSQIHYSHVINSCELQHCNWNCNCSLINPSLSAPKSVFSSDFVLSAPRSAVFSSDFVLFLHPKLLLFQGFCPLCTQKCCFSRDFVFSAPKSAVFFQGRTSITVMGQLRSANQFRGIL